MTAWSPLIGGGWGVIQWRPQAGHAMLTPVLDRIELSYGEGLRSPFRVRSQSKRKLEDHMVRIEEKIDRMLEQRR